MLPRLLTRAAEGASRLPYYNAGLGVGLLQGYVLVLAEIAAGLGLSRLSAELRRLLPAKKPPPRSSSSSSEPAPPGGAGATQQQTGGVRVAPAAAARHKHQPLSTPSALTTAAAIAGKLDGPAVAGDGASPQDAGGSSYPATPTATVQAPLAHSSSPPRAIGGTPAAGSEAAAAAEAGSRGPEVLVGVVQLEELAQLPPLDDGTYGKQAPGAPGAAAGGGLSEEAVAALPSDLFRRLSSFPLEHVSPPTTAATTATYLYPSGHLEHVAALDAAAAGAGGAGAGDQGGQGGAAAGGEEEDFGSAGIDVAVGPLEPVEGEMDMEVTNSTGSNLLQPADAAADGQAVGSLAASAAAAAAALAKQQQHRSLDGGDDTRLQADTARPVLRPVPRATAGASPVPPPPAVAAPAPRGSSGAGTAYRIGRPAQRHVSPGGSSSSGSRDGSAHHHTSTSAPVIQQPPTRERSLRKVSFSDEQRSAAADSSSSSAVGGEQLASSSSSGGKAAKKSKGAFAAGPLAAIKKAIKRAKEAREARQ